MEPRVVQSGYFLNGFPVLRAVPSDYAFNCEQSSQRLPSQTFSQYQFHGLNSWRTATSNPAYHYVRGDEIPHPTEDEQVTKGNIISLKALRERISTLDDGFYRPTMVNGVLYLVSSGEDETRTARETESATNLKTALENPSPLHTAREQDSELHTARLAQSPHVKASVPDVRLTLNQLRRLLGRELFREVIKKYKKEHKAGRMSASGNDINEDVATARSPSVTQSPRTALGHSPARTLSLKTARSDRSEANLRTGIEAVSPSLALHTACSMTDVHSDRPESNVNTAVEPMTSEFGTAHNLDSGTSTPASCRSSQDVTTAIEITPAVRALLDSHISDQLRTAQSPCDTSSKDVETAREITESVRALLSEHLSNPSSNNSTNLRNELDSMVASAEQHLKHPVGFLQADAKRSVTEVNAPSHRFAQTPETFDSRAASSAKNLGAASAQQNLTSFDTTVKTALENPSETNVGAITSTSSTMAI